MPTPAVMARAAPAVNKSGCLRARDEALPHALEARLGAGGGGGGGALSLLKGGNGIEMDGGPCMLSDATGPGKQWTCCSSKTTYSGHSIPAPPSRASWSAARASWKAPAPRATSRARRGVGRGRWSWRWRGWCALLFTRRDIRECRGAGGRAAALRLTLMPTRECCCCAVLLARRLVGLSFVLPLPELVRSGVGSKGGRLRTTSAPDARVGGKNKAQGGHTQAHVTKSTRHWGCDVMCAAHRAAPSRGEV